MNKALFSLFCFAATLIFAEGTTILFPDSVNAKVPPPDASLPKMGYFYLRFATADTDMIHSNAICPGIGLGYRRLAGDGAIDISINGNGSNHFDKNCWNFPKLSYLHYLAPSGKQSAYLGGGLAWGGVDALKRRFTGIFANVTLGYELTHRAPFLGFAELNLSQPAVPLEHRGGFPGPIAELSVGAGF